MELGTFGAIISFALEMELQALENSERLDKTMFPQIETRLQNSSRKRINRLRRIRQELVTEMILEPITGVESGDFFITIAEGSNATDQLQQAIRLEENLHRFYSTMGPLIPMKEVQRAFARLSKENDTRKDVLENISSNI